MVSCYHGTLIDHVISGGLYVPSSQGLEELVVVRKFAEGSPSDRGGIARVCTVGSSSETVGSVSCAALGAS